MPARVGRESGTRCFPTGRARRRAVALQHTSQHAGRRCGRVRCGPLVRCRRQCSGDAIRSARVPAYALPCRMRRSRGCVDRIDPLGWTHARRTGLARHPGRRGRGALAPRADDGGLGPRGRAPQPVERRGRMHLPRRARRATVRRRTTSPARAVHRSACARCRPCRAHPAPLRPSSLRSPASLGPTCRSPTIAGECRHRCRPC